MRVHGSPTLDGQQPVSIELAASAEPRDASVVPSDLRTEDDSGLIATAIASPRLSWRLAAERPGVRQLAYEIQVGTDPNFKRSVAGSGVVECASPLLAPWPAGPLQSRERKWWRVRVRTDRGWTDWSGTACVEGSLYDKDDWVARAVSPLSNAGRIEPSPPFLLRREFSLEGFTSARLYVTALGVHQLYVNGEPVSADLLEPGWTSYRHRTLFAAYDILHLLRQGRNCIAAEVSDGWWRGELGWLGVRGHYGDTTALVAQLEIVTAAGHRQVLATDETWLAGYGATRMAELYDGVDVDRRAEPRGWKLAGFDDKGWEAVAIQDLPAGLEQRAMPAVRVIERHMPAKLERREGLIRVDAGQNLVGYLSLRARGPAGAAVRVRHAEMLESDGSLHLAPLRNARASDHYILRGDENDELLVPSFTFHGFRYAEICIDPDVVIGEVEVILIASDLDYSGRFECSDANVTKLFENSVRSQKGNFITLPTDCPQRDERLGWTGDIQVFAETACLNADARSFLANWLVDLAHEQRADGNVPAVVPDVIKGHEFEYAGVGWGDAATLIPWTLYETYGDLGVLQRQYPSMRAWVDFGTSRLDSDGVWSGDFHLGDWLDPGAPADRPHLATTDRDFIATAYLSLSCHRVAQAARALGVFEQSDHYDALSRSIAAAAWQRWHESAVTTQAGCGIAIMFDIAPFAEQARVGQHLADLVTANDGRIATGFLGTPLLLPALSRTGQHAAAYRLLLNRKCPGWLYQVDRGATTMWERWDAVGEDGELHSGAMSTEEANSMISFNHYAYGAVSAWLYRNVAGLSADPASPGFGRIRFAPEPGGDLDWASASLMTGYGEAAIRWELLGEGIQVELTVPPGATGHFHCPPGLELPGGSLAQELASGQHLLRLVPR